MRAFRILTNLPIILAVLFKRKMLKGLVKAAQQQLYDACAKVCDTCKEPGSCDPNFCDKANGKVTHFTRNLQAVSELLADEEARLTKLLS